MIQIEQGAPYSQSSLLIVIGKDLSMKRRGG